MGVEIIVPLGMFAMVVLIVYFVYSYTHKERMRMLEIGLAPSPTRGGLTGMSSLWLGLVTGAIGLALIVTQILGYDRHHLVAGLICLFIGAALLIYYKLTESKRKQEIRLREEYQADLVRQMAASKGKQLDE